MLTKKWKNNLFLLKQKTSPTKKGRMVTWMPSPTSNLQQHHFKLLMGLSRVTLVSWKCACWLPSQSCCPTRWFLALYPLPFSKSNTPSVSNGNVTSCLSIFFSFFRRIGPIKPHTLWALLHMLLRTVYKLLYYHHIS